MTACRISASPSTVIMRFRVGCGPQTAPSEDVCKSRLGVGRRICVCFSALTKGKQETGTRSHELAFSLEPTTVLGLDMRHRRPSSFPAHKTNWKLCLHRPLLATHLPNSGSAPSPSLSAAALAPPPSSPPHIRPSSR
jgi:hypothetical protein